MKASVTFEKEEVYKILSERLQTIFPLPEGKEWVYVYDAYAFRFEIKNFTEESSLQREDSNGI
jgi:hypothetical protein